MATGGNTCVLLPCQHSGCARRGGLALLVARGGAPRGGGGVASGASGGRVRGRLQGVQVRQGVVQARHAGGVAGGEGGAGVLLVALDREHLRPQHWAGCRG